VTATLVGCCWGSLGAAGGMDLGGVTLGAVALGAAATSIAATGGAMAIGVALGRATLGAVEVMVGSSVGTTMTEARTGGVCGAGAIDWVAARAATLEFAGGLLWEATAMMGRVSGEAIAKVLGRETGVSVGTAQSLAGAVGSGTMGVVAAARADSPTMTVAIENIATAGTRIAGSTN
jgi:hypothetical protein